MNQIVNKKFIKTIKLEKFGLIFNIFNILLFRIEND